MLLDIRNDLNFWNHTGTWEASCAGTTVCSITHTYDVILLDPQGSVVPVPESDTQMREFVAQSLAASPQPNVTYYKRDPAMAAAMAPGDVGPADYISVATIGHTTYVGDNSPAGWSSGEWNNFYNWCNNNPGRC